VLQQTAVEATKERPMAGDRETDLGGAAGGSGEPSWVVGLVVWGALIGILLAYQGWCLVRNTDRWPALSDIFRVVTRTPLGRWVLFGLWLWFGWHLFVRGWRFFLRD
jgi:Family of unknown function (DUF6186)